MGTWIERLRRYLAEPKSNGGELMPLCDCLKMLGQKKPLIATHFLDSMDDALVPLLTTLLLGIDASGDVITPAFIWRWIDQGQYLPRIAEYLSSQVAFNPDMLVAVTARAIEFADDDAVIAVVNAAASCHNKAPNQRLINEVFLPAVRYLTEMTKPHWIESAWGLYSGTLLAALDEAQSKEFLHSFVELPEIDFHVDHVLALIAARFPRLIFEFFETRIKRDGNPDELHFDPVPFRLHELQGTLSRSPAMLMDAVRRWHASEPDYHEYRGGRLIRNVFPTLSPDIADPLTEVVKTGDREDLDFVLTTLAAYDGDAQVYPLCMGVVERLDENDEWLARVSNILDKTGVVTGEFGFVEAKVAQRALLEQWREDPRPKVRAYSTARLRQTNQSMAWEQRNAERDAEQRKRDWGEA